MLNHKIILQEKPLEIEQKPKKLKIRIKKYTGKPNIESKFKKGEKVEVSSDEEGYKGAWFVASIVDTLEKDKFLVEYRDLMNDDGTQLLKEEIDAMFIRPCPPQLQNFGCYKRLQEVDAWYNDGWWKGMVVGLLNGKECFVRFMYNEVLKFEYSKLRPHQDLFEGKWVISSNKVKYLTFSFHKLTFLLLISCKSLYNSKIWSHCSCDMIRLTCMLIYDALTLALRLK